MRDRKHLEMHPGPWDVWFSSLIVELCIILSLFCIEQFNTVLITVNNKKIDTQ